MSLHAAGLSEPSNVYVWENLASHNFARAAAPSLNAKLITRSQREYAIAGVLHLDHLATINQSDVHAQSIAHNIFALSHSLGLEEADTTTHLNRVLDQHRSEWAAFTRSLGAESFIADWMEGGQS